MDDVSIGLERASTSVTSKGKHELSTNTVDVNNKSDEAPAETLGGSTRTVKRELDQKSVKRVIKNHWRSIVNSKRKRPVESKESEYEFGAPYVVLAQERGNPITCYMVPKKDSNVKQYIATTPQTLVSPQLRSNVTSTKTSRILTQVKPSSQTAEPIKVRVIDNLDQTILDSSNSDAVDSCQNSLTFNQGGSISKLNLPQVKQTSNQKHVSTNLTQIASNFKQNPAVTMSPEVKLNPNQKVTTFILPTGKPCSSQIQFNVIAPQSNISGAQVVSSSQLVSKTITKVSPPFKSVAAAQGVTFPLRQVLPKVNEKKELANSSHLLEVQKYLEEKIKSLKVELEENKNKITDQKRNGFLIKTLQDKLKNKRKQIKTMCTQRKRLTKRLDSCREELEKTRKALELVESQAILWNNSNLSDLGKLIFSLHTVKSKKSLDTKLAASRAPPEVKGFVISLYMTSPKAYQLVRDCFNGLPHPKTVAKWLHGERIEDADFPLDKKGEVNQITLEETFSRVLEEEVEEVQQLQETETIIDESLLTGHEININIDNDPSAVYYVLDEKGNVTGQLTGSTADILFTSNGFDLKSLPQHEVVISE